MPGIWIFHFGYKTCWLIDWWFLSTLFCPSKSFKFNIIFRSRVFRGMRN